MSASLNQRHLKYKPKMIFLFLVLYTKHLIEFQKICISAGKIIQFHVCFSLSWGHLIWVKRQGPVFIPSILAGPCLLWDLSAQAPSPHITYMVPETQPYIIYHCIVVHFDKRASSASNYYSLILIGFSLQSLLSTRKGDGETGRKR